LKLADEHKTTANARSWSFFCFELPTHRIAGRAHLFAPAGSSRAVSGFSNLFGANGEKDAAAFADNFVTRWKPQSMLCTSVMGIFYVIGTSRYGKNSD
jgi:hypothetical protein